MIYRAMTSEDVNKMILFERQNRLQEPGVFKPFLENQFRAKFIEYKIENSDANHTIIVLNEDSVIGRIDLMIEMSYMDFKKIGYVDWVYVQKPYRNKGVAKELFKQAEMFLKEQNCELYYLFVAKNEEAQGFYSSIHIDREMIERASKKLI